MLCQRKLAAFPNKKAADLATAAGINTAVCGLPLTCGQAGDHCPDSVLLASEVVDGVTHRFGGVLHLVLEGTSRIHK
jgi:hypothetical protein